MSDTITTFSESSSSSPGTILKRCREYHGLSLEEASETTKIGISYLKALEEDQISEFANLTYLKGFLRIYTTYLGLNSDDMSRMYDKLNGAKGEKNDADSTTAERALPLRRMVSLQKLALPAFLLLLIVVTATFFKRSPVPPARPSQPVTVPVAAVPPTPVQPVRSSASAKAVVIPEAEKPPAESGAVETDADEKQVLPKRPVDVTRSFILKIRVTQNSTLTATVDGSEPQNYDLTDGDIIEWKAEKSVTLDVSNAGGINVELNGKPYKQLGSSGKPVYVELDADGIKP